MKTKEIKSVTASATIWLHGAKLDPKEVTKCCGVIPTKKWSKGDVHITSTGKEIVRKVSMWELGASNSSSPVLEQVTNLLDQLKETGNLFDCLPHLESAKLSVFYAIDHDDEGEGKIDLSFSNEILTAAAVLGLEIEISMHVVRP
ncbi:MAG: DUF4279 domain-containing protein [Bacteroidota bacterium]